MPRREPDGGLCCFCGLPYERLGNNPRPLAWEGRCCDACNEIVIEARIDPKKLLAEQDRVMEALRRMRGGKEDQMALAAICASRGPVLLDDNKRKISLIKSMMEEEKALSRAYDRVIDEENTSKK